MRVLWTALLCSCFSIGLLFSAPPTMLTIDLAKESPDKIAKRSVRSGGDLALRIVNEIPGRRYKVDTEIAPEPIPPLSLSGVVEAASPCDAPAAFIRETFEGATEERAVPATLEEIRAAVDECGEEGREERRAALEAEIGRQTTWLLSEAYVLKQGESLTVTVQRLAADGAAVDRSWTIVYSSGARGDWRVAYGFTFIPNRDEEFYSQEQESNPGVFVITEQEDRKELDFAPSIFFNWLPTGKRQRNWIWGPTAGLGFDLDNPILFGGIAGTFNENVSVTLGAVIHKQKRLDGRFRVGQEISENLESSQLEDETFDANVYFGLAFRLGKSPFKKESEEQPAGTGEGSGE